MFSVSVKGAKTQVTNDVTALFGHNGISWNWKQMIPRLVPTSKVANNIGDFNERLGNNRESPEKSWQSYKKLLTHQTLI